MKRILYHLGLILLVFGSMINMPFIASGQDYYQKGIYRLTRSHYDGAFVSSLNVQACAERYLPNFLVSPKPVIWHYGKLYRCSYYSTSVGIQIGIYQDVQEAEESALENLNGLTAYFMEGPIKGISVGDNCWWYKGVYEGESEPRIEGVAFLRKNIFMMISTNMGQRDYFKDILPLCQSIDNDLLNGASYLALENSLHPPVVNSLQLSTNVLKLRETAFVTVSATDPKGKKLEYITRGMSKNDNDPENIFRILADVDFYFPDPFYGTHTLECWVINEDNFFSKVFKTSVTF